MSKRLPIAEGSALPPAAASARGAFELAAKRRVLQAARLVRWRLFPREYPAPEPWTGPLPDTLLGELSVRVDREDAAAHPVLEEGKRHNLARAASAFQGLRIRPGRPFSFWRALGRVTAARGFRAGLAISGGCLTPEIGGGLCLLSNALFELAVRSGFRILERHGHTQEAVPPAPDVLWGLDATVAWPDVDLRFEPRSGEVRIDVQLAGDELRVEARGDGGRPMEVELSMEGDQTLEVPSGRRRENRIRRRVLFASSGPWVDEIVAENRRRLLSDGTRARTCLTCGEAACHRRADHQGGG